MLMVPGLLLAIILGGCSRAEITPETDRMAATVPAEPVDHDFARWEKEIAAYEAADRASPPPQGGIVFTGSSTIRLWKSLQQDFPRHHVLNRGFGGSQIVDVTHFADRIIFPYEPRMVFLRSGTNDIHAGKSAERVFEEYKAFVARIHAQLPRTKIVFIGLCPAPSRWSEREANQTLNQLVAGYARRRSYLEYVETYEMSVNADGSPKRDLFVADQLHFNAEGYRLLAQRVRPFLPK